MWSLDPFPGLSFSSVFPSSVRRHPEPGPLAKAANERHRQLVRFNEHSCPDVEGESIPEFIYAQAKRAPTSPAIRRGDEVVSYRSMIDRAEQVGRMLRRSGVTKGDEVRLLSGPTADLPSAMLGVWGIGATCMLLPLGPELEGVLEGGDGCPILTTPRVLDDLPRRLRGQTICVQPRVGEGPASASDLEGFPVAPCEPALVWYEGTGENRGREVVTHRAIRNWIAWYQGDASRGAGSATAQWADPSSPLFAHELASAWSAGGCLVLPERDRPGTVEHLVQFVATTPVHRLVLPSSCLSEFARTARKSRDPLTQLHEVIVVGGPGRLDAPVQAFFRGRPDCNLVTISGPCPGLLCTGYQRTGRVETWDGRPLVGRPLPDARTYVLDRGRRLVPTGVPGELYLGGRLVTERAVMGGTDAHPDRWLDDPFSEDPGGVLYRTGQRVRFLEDGTLELLGGEISSGEGISRAGWAGSELAPRVRG